MLDTLRPYFSDTFGSADDVEVFMAPGRVNLIGEYTDFNGGFVFPMTVDRGVYLGIRPRVDQRVRIASKRFDELINSTLGEFKRPEPGHWSCYVLGLSLIHI